MEQSPSWEADSYSEGQEISPFYVTRMFITVFTRARNWSYPGLDESNPHFSTLFP
jgi:hypothetical protein